MNIYQAPMRAKEKHKHTKNDKEKGTGITKYTGQRIYMVAKPLILHDRAASSGIILKVVCSVNLEIPSTDRPYESMLIFFFMESLMFSEDRFSSSRFSFSFVIFSL